ncbi:MAG TPA: amidohydrolase family protein [Steroidobacteraceae bacterium]|nr:amidohydrolase family protein [Steroidobacteraceae bacterium]
MKRCLRFCACLSLLCLTFPAFADELRYAFITADKREGGLTLERHADGRRTVDFQFNDRGRGPKTREEFRLGPAGVPITYSATGRAYMGSAVAEKYSLANGKARWTASGEHGESQVDAPHLYVAVNGSPAASAMAARSLLAAADNTLPALPGGQLSIRRIQSIPVKRNDAKMEVTLYAISGVDLGPELIWLDPENELFGQHYGWSALVREGWEGSAPQLWQVQQSAEFVLLETLAKQLARQPSTPVAFRNVRVFDSLTGKTSAPATVYVFLDRITRIDASNSAPAADIESIDGTGHTLLPGLADMHDHLSGWRALMQIAGGVTTARDLANDNMSLLDLQTRIESGKLVGPRIHRAGFIDGKSPFTAPTGNVAATLEEALAKTDWYADRGYTQLKLYSSLPPEWVEPIARAAHERGMRVSGHIPAFMTAAQAVRAGYDEINHMNMVLLNFVAGPRDDTRTPVRFIAVGERAGALDLESAQVRDFIGLLKERGTVVDTTVTIFETLFLSKPGAMSPSYAAIADHLPIATQRRYRAGSLDIKPADEAKYAAAFQTMLRMVAKLHAAGVPLVAGTDDMAGFTLHRELELYVQAGIPASRALQIATIDAQRLLHADQSFGSVAPGKIADLILVRGDPSANISDIRNVRLVMKSGTVYEPDELYRAIGVKPFD